MAIRSEAEIEVQFANERLEYAIERQRHARIFLREHNKKVKRKKEELEEALALVAREFSEVT